ncbi:family 16 glycosylhydrolase [Labilibacter marinus]|uniref:family 16 glycosylhydrolase n=1 Tax=Labilibacter marinus TaxID=1477105 RepID=UPI00082EA03C|nr:family 16 glycosylhydrolase [Labilibacter marinus]
MLRIKKILKNIGVYVVLLHTTSLVAQTYPYSDLSNTGNWQLNEEVSDEFDAVQLNEDKWWVVGKLVDGQPVYEDPDNPAKNVWIGRAPSQFSGNNYRLEDGKLILETRWEPDFPFSETAQSDGMVYENITTPCIIGRKMFQYGYMEIKSKAADAEITSSFWATGNNTEFDMFEMFGDHRQPNKLDKNRELWWSIHDWSPGKGGASVYTEHHDLGFRVADDFHIYGIEWDETGVKYYVDGVLFTQATAEEIDAYAEAKGHDKGYVITKSIKIWLDQETFPWHGIPDSKADLELNSPAGEKEDGIVDFEIEYVRVWQKEVEESRNLLDDAFYSFDAPISIDGASKNWYIPAASTSYFTIQNTKAATGINALKFAHSTTLTETAVAFAPFKSMQLETGEFTFSMKVWLEPNSAIDEIDVIFEDPWLINSFDLTGIETGKWVVLTRNFTRNQVSGSNDRIRLRIESGDVSGTSSTLYIDDISVESSTTTSIHNKSNLSYSVYPNPCNDILNIEAPLVKYVYIYNHMGALLKKEEKITEPCVLPIADLQSGLYLLVLESDNDKVTTKIKVRN